MLLERRGTIAISSALAVILILAVVLVAAIVVLDERPIRPTSTTSSSNGFWDPSWGPTPNWINYTYCQSSSTDNLGLKMDVYSPTSGSGSPSPVVIYIHGGGWYTGDKVPVPVDILKLLSVGVTVVSLEYRLSPTYTWPAPIEDIKCAVRSLRAHASLFNIDGSRIAAFGESAGGHLTAVLALATDNSTYPWDVGQYTSYSSGITAAAFLSGPSNLTASNFGPMGLLKIPQEFGNDTSVRISASPVYEAHSGAPPFYISYGYNDTLVPYDQGVELQNALVNAGVTVTLVLVDNAAHDLGSVPNDPNPPSPPPAQVQQNINNFYLANFGMG